MPGQPLNVCGVNDPKLTEMIKLQRRTFDVAKRQRDHLRHPALLSPTRPTSSSDGLGKIAVGAWDAHIKNYGPNIGYDYGGRLMAAWLDR